MLAGRFSVLLIARAPLFPLRGMAPQSLIWIPVRAGLSRADGTGKVPIPGEDANYMTFGWWFRDPANAEDAPGFNVFDDVAGGAGALPTAGNLAYKGPAVGKYVWQKEGTVSVGTVVRPAAESGSFTATVDLTANASGVSGSVHSFTGGALSGSGLRLGLDNVATSGASGTPTLSIGGTGGIDNDEGNSWTYDLVGTHAADANLAASAIAGNFNASIPNRVQIVGAFGAKRQ